MKSYSVNKAGVYAIQSWIDDHLDHNPQVANLWAGGIAAEIGQCASLDADLENTQEFSYELLRDAQGHIMTINLDLKHFDAHEYDTEQSGGAS